MSFLPNYPDRKEKKDWKKHKWGGENRLKESEMP